MRRNSQFSGRRARQDTSPWHESIVQHQGYQRYIPAYQLEQISSNCNDPKLLHGQRSSWLRAARPPRLPHFWRHPRLPSTLSLLNGHREHTMLTVLVAEKFHSEQGLATSCVLNSLNRRILPTLTDHPTTRLRLHRGPYIYISVATFAR